MPASPSKNDCDTSQLNAIICVPVPHRLTPCHPPSGKYWCWVHWDIQVQTFDFLVSKELLVRAWDETMNTQPAVITWNLMGMMNNCYHRCVISVMAKAHDE